MADREALLRVLRSFARTMARNYDVPNVLQQLADDVVEILGATAAGVALCDDGVLRFFTATSDRAGAAEAAQERFQAGPCVASIQHGRPVPVGDVRERHEDWPDYAPELERIGFRAVLGVPLVLDDRQVGSLDVYDTLPRVWTDDVVSAAEVLADVAAAFVLNASELAQAQRTTEQLQTALHSRVVIEQAKGVLAERVGISTEEAFQRIRSAARGQSTRITNICHKVIDTDYIPD